MRTKKMRELSVAYNFSKNEVCYWLASFTSKRKCRILDSEKAFRLLCTLQERIKNRMGKTYSDVSHNGFLYSPITTDGGGKGWMEL